MNSVYIIAFFLLSASFCTAIQERSTRTRNWADVNAGDHKYLALLAHAGTTKYCSGSITSLSTVLTFCTDKPTNAYAGVLKVQDLTNNPIGMQERKVDPVKQHDAPLNALMICFVTKNWEFKDNVGPISLPNGKRGRSMTDCTLLGFGKGGGEAQKLTGQQIGEASVCTEGVTATAGEMYSNVLKANKENLKLKPLDLGGPAVCSNEQWGINKEFKDSANDGCNVFVNISTYRGWINEQINAAEDGEAGKPVENNGNSTSPSSAYSIHSYLNKYSNWKVLLLCLMAIKVLVY